MVQSNWKKLLSIVLDNELSYALCLDQTYALFDLLYLQQYTRWKRSCSLFDRFLKHFWDNRPRWVQWLFWNLNSVYIRGVMGFLAQQFRTRLELAHLLIYKRNMLDSKQFLKHFHVASLSSLYAPYQHVIYCDPLWWSPRTHCLDVDLSQLRRDKLGCLDQQFLSNAGSILYTTVQHNQWIHFWYGTSV